MSVLVVATETMEAITLASMGSRFAHALGERLVVVFLRDDGSDSDDDQSFRVLVGADPPVDVPPILAPLASALHDLREANGAEADIELHSLRGSTPLKLVLDLVATVDAKHVIAAQHRRGGKAADAVASKLFAASPAHTILVGLGAEQSVRSWNRILVPTAGGPNARVALRLGAALARALDGRMTALFVESPDGDLAEEVGRLRLADALEEAGLDEPETIETRVELASDVAEAVRAVADEDFDFVLVGASHARALKRQLFATGPHHDEVRADAPAVAVVRRRWPAHERLRARIDRWLDLTVPQLSRDERIALYSKLERGSAWSFDFMTLIGLSTAIATLGLLQDSGAVVIGAMLVAPLMTPILGAGLALVQGNLPLLRVATKAICLGYLLALAIGFAGGALVPLDALTPQLLARGGPTLLDLGVALFSGFAAAYCIAREGLYAALPGVAIAAALVPPIATTGVSLAAGASANAYGSFLLFATNVTAIILGAAMALWAGGVRGKREDPDRRQRWVRWAFLLLLIGTVALSVPLSERLALDHVPDRFRAAVARRLAAEPGVDLIGIAARRDEQGDAVVEIRLRSGTPVSEALAHELARTLEPWRRPGQRVRVATEIARELP